MTAAKRRLLRCPQEGSRWRPWKGRDRLEGSLSHKVADYLQLRPVGLCIHPRGRGKKIHPKQGPVGRYIGAPCRKHNTPDSDLGDDKRAQQARLAAAVERAADDSLT